MLRASLAACFLSLAFFACAATPDAVTPDGGRYYGPLVDGKLQGKGRIEWDNGSSYEGEFANGLMSGKGELRYANGRVYRGDFVRGQMQGNGRYETGDGEVYEGDFAKDTFTGKGIHRLPNGDVYEGHFVDWQYEGQGTLTYARPRADGRTKVSGIWHHGWLQNDPEEARTLANVETALYAQRRLLDKALASLEPRDPGRINLYLLAVAGDGSQEVFHREVEFVQRQFAERFGTAGRTVTLVNSRNTVGSLPMATTTSIGESLKAIAARMDVNEDILFLFMTSHGSREHGFYLNENGMNLPNLSPAALAKQLKDSGIRWKVVLVSACYSGTFIDPLQDGRTLVIAAARKDRTSFGCADENDFTYFGRAYFKESLPKAGSFQDAFQKAAGLVQEWELKDAANPQGAGKADKEDNRSYPQISSSPEIDARLKRWWAQLPH
jgi:hypothetical protein